jgi:hypothetical protein
MTMLSFNARVVGDAYKKLALIRLFSKYNLDVIMLQETMCKGPKVEAILKYGISFM